MAEHHTPRVADNDYVQHEKTYEFFLVLAKWGTIGVIILMLFIGSMTALVPWALTLFSSAVLLYAGAKL